MHIEAIRKAIGSPIVDLRVPFTKGDDDLISFGHGWYGCVDVDSAGEPILFSVYWARSVAFLKALFHNDGGALSALSDASGEAWPDPDDLIPGTKLKEWSYGGLFASGLPRSEAASYDNKGKFVLKRVNCVDMHVYYRSRLRRKHEMPFAIMLIPKTPPKW